MNGIGTNGINQGNKAALATLDEHTAAALNITMRNTSGAFAEQANRLEIAFAELRRQKAEGTPQGAAEALQTVMAAARDADVFLTRHLKTRLVRVVK